MTRARSYTYWHPPCKAEMIVNVGSWTDNDNYKLGGYFATDLDAELFVALDTASWTVRKATASSDILIGKMISQPEGEHTASGARATILMFGDMIQEVEVHTSSDAIAMGDSVVFYGTGGSYSAGLFAKSIVVTHSVTGSADATLSTMYNGTVALATTEASGSIASGTVIPVLFGYTRFNGAVRFVVDG